MFNVWHWHNIEPCGCLHWITFISSNYYPCLLVSVMSVCVSVLHRLSLVIPPHVIWFLNFPQLEKSRFVSATISTIKFSSFWCFSPAHSLESQCLRNLYLSLPHLLFLSPSLASNQSTRTMSPSITTTTYILMPVPTNNYHI